MPLLSLHSIEMQLCMQHLDCAALLRFARCSRRLLAEVQHPFAWLKTRCELRITDVTQSLKMLQSLVLPAAPKESAVVRLVWFPLVPKDADSPGVAGVSDFLQLAGHCHPPLSELHLAGPLDFFRGSQLFSLFHAPELAQLRVLHLHRVCVQQLHGLPPTNALIPEVLARSLDDIAALPRLESLCGLPDSIDIAPLVKAPALIHLSLLRIGWAQDRPALRQVSSLPHLVHCELRSPLLYRLNFCDFCESAMGRRLHTLAIRDVPIARILRSKPQTQADLAQHFGRCFSAMQSLRKLTLGSVAGVQLLFPYLIQHQPLLETLVIEPSCLEPDCEVDTRDPANATSATSEALIQLLSALPRLYVIIRLQRRRYSEHSLELASDPELVAFRARFLVQLDPSLAELGLSLPRPDRNSCAEDDPSDSTALSSMDRTRAKSKKCVLM